MFVGIKMYPAWFIGIQGAREHGWRSRGKTVYPSSS